MAIYQPKNAMLKQTVRVEQGPVVKNIKNGRLYVVLEEALDVTENADIPVIVYGPLPYQAFDSPRYVRAESEFEKKFTKVSREEIELPPPGPGE